jgi:hypothetical protein
MLVGSCHQPQQLAVHSCLYRQVPVDTYRSEVQGACPRGLYSVWVWAGDAVKPVAACQICLHTTPAINCAVGGSTCCTVEMYAAAGIGEVDILVEHPGAGALVARGLDRMWLVHVHHVCVSCLSTHLCAGV